MLSLRLKIVAIVFLSTLVLAVSLWGMSHLTIMKAFELLETRDAEANVERVRNTVKKKFESLSATVSDWGAWTDAYNFVLDRNQEFIDENLLNMSACNIKIHIGIYYDIKKDVAGKISCRYESGEDLEIPSSVYRFFSQNDHFFEHKSSDDIKASFVIFPEGAAYVASHPVVKSDGTGDIRGSVIFIKYMNKSEVKYLSEVTGLSVISRIIRNIKSDSHWASIKSLSLDKPSLIIPKNSKQLNGYTIFPDWSGKPAVALRITFDRPVMMQGLRAIRLFLYMIFGFSVVFAIVMFYSIDHMVVKRLIKLITDARKIGATGDLNRRVRVSGQDEIWFLGSTMNRMIEEIGNKNQEIKSIMDHISVAIFTISDQVNLEIDKIRSKSTESILKARSNQKFNIDTLLLDHSNLTNEQKQLVRNCIFASIGEDVFSFEANADHLPRNLTLKFDGDDEIFVEIDWGVALKSDGGSTVQKIIAACRDVTSVREANAREMARAREMKLVGELIAITHEKFTIFRDSTYRFLDEIVSTCLSSDNELSRRMKMIYINLHTIKGAAKTLGLTEITEKVHETEEKISAWQNDSSYPDWEFLVKEARVIESILAEYDSISHEKLNRKDYDHDSVVLHRLDVLKMIEKIKDNEKLGEDELTVLSSSVFVPIDNLADEAKTNLPRLAKDLGKPEPRVNALSTDGLYLTPEAFSALVPAFIHIMRNSMDHGIESEELRKSKGKDARGLFSIHSCLEYGLLTIRISDDGQGLNLNKIRELGVKRGLIEQGREYSHQDLAQLIFSEGFSTANAVTEISGRGVGMAAIRELLGAIGGTLEIEFTDEPAVGFVPFEFVISLPSSHAMRISTQKHESDHKSIASF